MKKKLLIGLSIILILAILLIPLLLLNKNKSVEPIYLENNYYSKSGMKEIKIEELHNLINKKESFAVFVYQPMCMTSSNFERVLSSFLEENQMNIYKISFSNIKDSELGKKIEYYPSFIIYNEGKIVDFLEADKDEDVEYFSSKAGFKKWFTRYVKLKETKNIKKETSLGEFSNNENKNLQSIDLKNVKREDNKVNIYFFWGDGCPHCKEEFEFLESIKEEYKEYYNLYSFETWHNEENAKLATTFANAMGDELKGVPYTIIGNKSFKGFSEKYKDEIVSTIEREHNNSYDVYFDKLKR